MLIRFIVVLQKFILEFDNDLGSSSIPAQHAILEDIESRWPDVIASSSGIGLSVNWKGTQSWAPCGLHLASVWTTNYVHNDSCQPWTKTVRAVSSPDIGVICLLMLGINLSTDMHGVQELFIGWNYCPVFKMCSNAKILWIGSLK